MKLNKNILKVFLESDDWTHDKTISLFEKVNFEKDEHIEDLKDEVMFYKDKYQELKRILDDTLEQYEKCLKLCNNMNKKLNIPKKDIGITVKRTISNLNLEELWNKMKDITSSEKDTKTKNKKLITLLCNYKQPLNELMGKDWYQECINLVEKFGTENQTKIYKKLLGKYEQIFQNEW